jgi:hypothetical protein
MQLPRVGLSESANPGLSDLIPSGLVGCNWKIMFITSHFLNWLTATGFLAVLRLRQSGGESAGAK